MSKEMSFGEKAKPQQNTKNFEYSYANDLKDSEALDMEFDKVQRQESEMKRKMAALMTSDSDLGTESLDRAS